MHNLIDICDEYVPGVAFLLDNLRWIRTDIISVFKSFQSRNEIDRRPPGLTVEVTNICNSNCRFCAYQHQNIFRIAKGIMSDDVFNKVMDDYKHLNGSFVGLTPFAGEPLLDPKIIKKVCKAKEIGAWTGFFTNGILLERFDIEALLKSGIDALTVSTGPLNRDMYELLFRNKHYDDMLEGLKRLLSTRNRIRKDFKINITFRSHIPRRQVFSLPDFKNIILPLLTREDIKEIVVNTRGFDPWGGLVTPNDMVGIMRLALPPRIKQRPCAWTFMLYVTWDGKVRACACRYGVSQNRDGIDDLYLGDITQTSLKDIWYGKTLKDLRRRFELGDLPEICQKCTVYRSY